MGYPRERRLTEAAPWLHLALLLALVSILEIARRLVGSEGALTYAVIARSMYTWLPTLAGIAISVLGPHRKSTRSAIAVAVAAIALMIVLDVTRTGPGDPRSSVALFPDASVGTTTQASRLASISWVRTAVAWTRGEISGINETGIDYGLDDPRVLVSNAVAEGGLLFVVFAAVGFVIAGMSWVRAHVLFKRDEDARAFYVALSWCVAPVVVGLSRQLAEEQRFRALFRGGALWRPLVPSLIALAAGVFLWWYTARYREPEDA
jgi:hypothetical protein